MTRVEKKINKMSEEDKNNFIDMIELKIDYCEKVGKLKYAIYEEIIRRRKKLSEKYKLSRNETSDILSKHCVEECSGLPKLEGYDVLVKEYEDGCKSYVLLDPDKNEIYSDWELEGMIVEIETERMRKQALE